MKLPAINGAHKIRNYKIISMYVRDNMSVENIAKHFGISVPRVYQVLTMNKEYIKHDVQYEKTKMLRRVLKEIEKKPESEKDVLDLIEQARKLLEGDKQQERTTPIIQIINYEDTRRVIPTEPICTRDFEESVTVQEHQLAQASEKDNASSEQAGS